MSTSGGKVDSCIEYQHEQTCGEGRLWWILYLHIIEYMIMMVMLFPHLCIRSKTLFFNNDCNENLKRWCCTELLFSVKAYISSMTLLWLNWGQWASFYNTMYSNWMVVAQQTDLTIYEVITHPCKLLFSVPEGCVITLMSGGIWPPQPARCKLFHHQNRCTPWGHLCPVCTHMLTVACLGVCT